MSFIRKWNAKPGLLALAIMIGSVLLAAPAAEAHVGFGVGFGVNLGAPPLVVAPHVVAPPPVVVAPPPVVVGPPGYYAYAPGPDYSYGPPPRNHAFWYDRYGYRHYY